MVLSFSHWPHHFLAIFSKVHQFVQNSVFIPRSACFVIFALGTSLFSVFRKCTSVYKTAFSERDQHVLSFLHWVHHFLAIFSKIREFVQNSVFSPRSARFSFSHWAYHFLALFSKAHQFVQNSVFSPRSACFVIFPLGAPLFSDFQQSARVSTKQRFQLKISTFCHFRTGCTTF